MILIAMSSFAETACEKFENRKPSIIMNEKVELKLIEMINKCGFEYKEKTLKIKKASWDIDYLEKIIFTQKLS